MADNLESARRVYEWYNERNFDEMADAMAEDGRLEIVGSGDVFTGPEGSRQFTMTWADAFPDSRITIDNMLEAGDFVVTEFTGRGTHTGTFVTPAGEIPATGKSVTLRFCDVTQFRDGKIVHQRSYMDTGSLMAQLGLAPQQQATTT